MTVDIGTLLIAHIFQNTALLAIIGVTALETAGRVKGPATWFKATVLTEIGVVLFLFRGFLPGPFGYEIPTLAMLAGVAMVVRGLRELSGDRPKPVVLAIVLAWAMIVYIFFRYVQPSVTGRVVIFSGGAAVGYAAGALHIFTRLRQDHRRSAGIAMLFFAFAAGTNLLRIWLYLATSRGADIFDPSSSDTLYYLLSLILLPGITYSQLQLVNSRLLGEIGRLADERALLVKEMNHRVKNSLSLAESIVSLQAGAAGENGVRLALESINARLHSISLVHDRLYRVDAGQDLRLDEYLSVLLGDISDSAGRYELGTDLAPTSADAGAAVSMGIIANELVTNAIKYSSAGGRAATILVRLHGDGPDMCLSVKDSGPGFPPESRHGLGTVLVDSLAGQLGGTVERTNDDGARVLVRIPKGRLSRPRAMG